MPSDRKTLDASSVKLWIAVALVSTITLGNYFLFDLPGAVGVGAGNTWQAWFKRHGAEYNESMNGMLYSIYSWPNFVLGVVGGLLVDHVVGLRNAAVLFTFCVLFGACVTYFGVVASSFPMLLFGRVLFGVGGETQIVAQYSFVGSWFEGRSGAGLAFGIVAAVQRLGAAATFSAGPYLAEHYGVLTATAGAVVVSAGCLVSLFGVLFLHTGLDNRKPDDEAQPPSWSKVAAEVRRAATRPLLLLALGNALFSMALYGYCAIAVPYLVLRDGLSETSAGTAMGVFFAGVIVAAPIAGYVVEATRYHMRWLTAASLLAALAAYVFGTGASVTGWQLSLVLAIPQAIVLSAVYPYVSKIVDLECEGFGFGILISAQNIGMAAATYANGAVISRVPKEAHLAGYQWLSNAEAFCFAAAAVAFAAVAWYSGGAHGPSPHDAPKKRHADDAGEERGEEARLVPVAAAPPATYGAPEEL